MLRKKMKARLWHDYGTIKMFPSKIEFYNPGGLLAGITSKNIVDKQCSRNPILAKVLSKVKYIEELGEGWDKIIKEHKIHPLNPKIPFIRDIEYPGWEADIKTNLIPLLRSQSKNFDKKIIKFQVIGRNSNSHKIAKSAFKEKDKPNYILSKEDILKWLK